MSDLTIQYDEEMVGAGHPTKNDTLNRLTLADHAADGSHFYKGFISGLTPKCTSAGTTLNIAPGAAEVNGKIYKLTSEISLTAGVATASSLYWYCVYIDSLPSSGNTLAASNFATGTLADVARNSSDGLLYKDTTKRVVGLYPTMSSVITPFCTAGGYYQLESKHLLLDDTTPPTTATALAAGLPPLGEPTEALFYIMIMFDGAGATLPSIKLYFNSRERYASRWPNANGSSARLYNNLEFTDPAYDGTLDFHTAYDGGTLAAFRLYLLRTNIPHGLAGAA